MIPSELIETLNGGMSVVVGTRDSAMMPECTRAWGLHVEPGSASLTIFLTESISQRTLENLRANGWIAISCSSPTTHQACQLKGIAERIRATNETDDARWRSWREKFKAAIGSVGVRTDWFGNLDLQPMLAVDVRVTDVFSQTPGPKAGERI